MCLGRVELTQLLRNSLLFIGLAGCESSNEPCQDTRCFADAAVLAVDEGNDELLDVVGSIPDALTRIAVMSSVITARPQTASQLCDRFPHGISKSRCAAAADRTHLWRVEDEPKGPMVRAGSGPALSAWSNQDFPIIEWTNPVALNGSCSGELDEMACVWANAVHSAREGDASRAAQWCKGMASNSAWRDDCYFQTAEVIVERWGRTHAADAFSLCGASNEYRGQCALELLERFAGKAPSSEVGDVVEWAPQFMTLRAVRDLFDDPVVRARIEDRYVALMTHASVLDAEELSGDFLDALPPDASPHVRAAISYRLITERSEALSLEDAVAMVQGTLEHRVEVPTDGLERPRNAVVDLWPYDREGESHLAAVSYLGHSRRTVANDPERDTEICVLEAAARAKPPWQTVLEEAKNHADERVRWTAVRLVEQLEARRLGTETAQWVPEPGEPKPDL